MGITIDEELTIITQQHYNNRILLTLSTLTMKLKTVLAFILSSCAILTMSAQDPKSYFTNPIINTSLPDPTVIRAKDGYFYLYATEDIRNLPIYKSPNLVDWTFVGTAFTDETHPSWNKRANIWAPDINYFDGHYVLYYAKSTWGGEWEAGIGVATADNPDGPFTDHGALFISKDLNTQNSIDADFIEEDGHKYLVWGSFRGIWYIELSADGLKLLEGAKPQQIAGTFMEASYIHKHGGYYYLFGSEGTCCEGEKSSYHIIVGRSKSLFGPYEDKRGRSMMENHAETILHRSDEVIGPGHNAEIFTDDEGKDWIIYHGFSAKDPDGGRLVWMDRVEWVDGWPHIANDRPSVISERPKFGSVLLADPTIFYDNGTYYLYGTGGMSGRQGEGFEVYKSTDMQHWEGPCGASNGYCLEKSDATWGTKGFWAPQVFKKDGKYYFVYTANEQIAIATSDSPLGPFGQDEPGFIPAQMKEIDPFIFFDGKKTYMYHVRLQDGNRIFVSEMNSDMKSLKESTTRECIHAEGGWEDTANADWKVSEGPTVVKIDKTYYLFYSCNDFRNRDYAVGYATAKSPLGPWTKQAEPIIVRGVIGEDGTGHGDLFQNSKGEWQYVFHTHFSPSVVTPRKTAVVTLDFDGSNFKLREGSFHFLQLP